MEKWCLHASLFLGNKDMFKNYKRFDFLHVQTADIGHTYQSLACETAINTGSP